MGQEAQGWAKSQFQVGHVTPGAASTEIWEDLMLERGGTSCFFYFDCVKDVNRLFFLSDSLCLWKMSEEKIQPFAVYSEKQQVLTSE